MMWILGVNLDPGTELEEEEKEVLNRFSKKMMTDMENRQKKGIMMVRKSSRWTGVNGDGGPRDASISSSMKLLFASVTVLNCPFLMFSRVEFIFPLSISPKKLVWQIGTHNMARARLYFMSRNESNMYN